MEQARSILFCCFSWVNRAIFFYYFIKKFGYSLNTKSLIIYLLQLFETNYALDMLTKLNENQRNV